MGIKERQTFKVNPNQGKKVSWKLEARNETIALTDKAWSFLQDGFLKENIATLTGSELVPEMAYVPSTGEIPVGESVGTTDHYGNYEILIRSRKGDLQNKECKIFQVL